MYARAVPSPRPTSGARRFAAAATVARSPKRDPLVPPGQPGALAGALQLGRLLVTVVLVLDAVLLALILPGFSAAGSGVAMSTIRRRPAEVDSGARTSRSTYSKTKPRPLASDRQAAADSGPHGPLSVAEDVTADHRHDPVDHQRQEQRRRT